jgi:hypothetical protein
MNPSKKARRLLDHMARIERMERGCLCRMTGRPHYNHQTWQQGRNCVRYVPVEQVPFVQAAIEGYEQFMRLAEQYADEIIRQTRRQRAKAFPPKRLRKPPRP